MPIDESSLGNKRQQTQQRQELAGKIDQRHPNVGFNGKPAGGEPQPDAVGQPVPERRQLVIPERPTIGNPNTAAIREAINNLRAKPDTMDANPVEEAKPDGEGNPVRELAPNVGQARPDSGVNAVDVYGDARPETAVEAKPDNEYNEDEVFRKPKRRGRTLEQIDASAVRNAVEASKNTPGSDRRQAIRSAIQERMGKPDEQATPEQTIPEQARPEQARPEQAVPEQAVPEQAVPEQAVPEQAVPEQAVPRSGFERQQQERVARQKARDAERKRFTGGTHTNVAKSDEYGQMLRHGQFAGKSLWNKDKKEHELPKKAKQRDKYAAKGRAETWSKTKAYERGHTALDEMKDKLFTANQDATQHQKDIANRLFESVGNNYDMFGIGLLQFEGDTVVKKKKYRQSNKKSDNGKTRQNGYYVHHHTKDKKPVWTTKHSDRVQKALEDIAVDIFGIDKKNAAKFVSDNKQLINQTIIIATGYGIDRNGNVFGTEYNSENKTRAAFVEDAHRCMAESMREWGHPFGITNYSLRQHRTTKEPRIPLGVCPKDIAELLIKNPKCKFKTVTDLQRACQRTWLGDHEAGIFGTVDYMAQRCYTDDTPDRKYAIEDLTRAICIHSNMDPADFGIPEYDHCDSYADMAIAHMSDSSYVDDEGMRLVWAMQEGRAKKRCLERRNRRAKRMRKVDDKNIPVMGIADAIATFGLSALKVFKVAGHIGLAVTSVIEYGLGSAEAHVANSTYFYGEGRKFKPTREMMRIAATDLRFREGLFAIKNLYDVGGADMVMAYFDENKDGQVTAAKVEAFLASMKPGMPLSMLNKANKALDAISDFMQVGSAVWKTADSKRFLESFMVQQAVYDGATSEEIYNALKYDPGLFISQAMNSPHGLEALGMMSNLNANRNSIMIRSLKDLLERNGFTEGLACTVFENCFLTYALKAFELGFPASNTIQLCLAKGYVKDKIESITDPNERAAAMDILANQLGGMDAIAELQGKGQRRRFMGVEVDASFKKAATYDMIKMGQTLGCLATAGLFIWSGGLKPPEDEKNWLVPWEWRVHLPWWEDGLYKPLHQTWYMDDIFMWSMPLAISISAIYGFGEEGAARKNGEYGDVPVFTGHDAWEMFWNGHEDIYDNNAVARSIRAMWELPYIAAMFYQAHQDEATFDNPVSAFLGDESMEDIKERAHRYEASVQPSARWYKLVNYITSPMGLSQFWDIEKVGDYERDPFKYRDENGEVHEWKDSDQILARYCLHNDVMAWIYNNFKGKKYLGWDNAEYKYDPDAVALSVSENCGSQKFIADAKEKAEKDGVEIGSDQALTNAWCKEVLDTIIEADDPSKLVWDGKNGYLFTADDAYILKQYAVNKIAALKKEWRQARKDCSEGKISTSTKWAIYDRNSVAQDELFDALQVLAYKGLIYDKKAYKILYGTTMRNPETGEYYNYGDSPGSLFSVFTTPDDTEIEWRTIYNEQTGEENNRGNFITESYRNDGTTAYARHDIPNKENSQVKQFQGELQEDLDKLKEIDNDDDSKNNNKNGGGYYYRGYSGGGGGSYTPNIYNTKPGSMNNPRAATMYSKTPYGASKNYLRPGYMTQGSRNAYARNEI